MRNNQNAPLPPKGEQKGRWPVEGKHWSEVDLRPGDRVSCEVIRDWWGYATGLITHFDAEGRPYFRPDYRRWGDRALTFERVIVLERARERRAVR
jgi:hypothetical protein